MDDAHILHPLQSSSILSLRWIRHGRAGSLNDSASGLLWSVSLLWKQPISSKQSGNQCFMSSTLLKFVPGTWRTFSVSLTFGNLFIGLLFWVQGWLHLRLVWLGSPFTFYGFSFLFEIKVSLTWTNFCSKVENVILSNIAKLFKTGLLWLRDFSFLYHYCLLSG